jgi:hypothetical protein
MTMIPQLRKPGRNRPYVTIVDTGLAMRCQNLLAGVALGQEEDPQWLPDLDKIEEAASALADELQRRTF